MHGRYYNNPSAGQATNFITSSLSLRCQRLLDYLAGHGGEVFLDEAALADLRDEGWSWRRLAQAMDDLCRLGLIHIRTFAGVQVIQALSEQGEVTE